MPSKDSKSEPCLLSMEVDMEDEDESYYRVLGGGLVRYITVDAGTFDEDGRSYFPLAAWPELPWHDTTWNVARIWRDTENGQLKTFLEHKTLEGVENTWHCVVVDVLDLNRTDRLTANAFEAEIPPSALPSYPELAASAGSSTLIAKIARFEWEIPRVEQETEAYRRLLALGISDIGPRFLGHLQENGRVMGLILEKLHGVRKVGIPDLKACEEVLRRLHGVGILHGDVNRFNFVLGPEGSAGMRMIDFECFREGDVAPGEFEREMDSLKEELVDESGRGGGFQRVDEQDWEE